MHSDNSNDAHMSDVEPPLLEEEEQHTQAEKTQEKDDGASIMDEMVAVATQAKAAKREQQEKERRANSKSSFGAGLKKGFFSSSAPKAKVKQNSTSAPLQRLEVADENKKEAVLRIVPDSNQASDGEAESESSSKFVFPEVQDAISSMNQLNPNEWMNDRFFAKISKHPKLLQALQNPRFTQAINELQQNPQAAVIKYQRDPDVSLMLRDFMEFLGNHFEELGNEQDPKQPQKQQRQQQLQKPAALPPIVDLDEARREAIASMKRSPDEEKQVQQILQNPELLAALSDARLMEQLRKCQEDPRAFQQLTNDPVLGPKLRLLVDAKMVTFA